MSELAQAVMTKAADWVFQAIEIYLPQCWKLEIQDQVASQFSPWWEPASCHRVTVLSHWLFVAVQREKATELSGVSS